MALYLLQREMGVKMPTRRCPERGDTIIELILAFAIFSLAAITTMIVLNSGISMSQRSLERSLVRQQIDSQVEIVRYLRDTNSPQWNAIKSKVTVSPTPLNGACPATVADAITSITGGFFLVPDGSSSFNIIDLGHSSFELPSVYASVDYAARKSRGLWVQVAAAENKTPSGQLAAYDFYVHACWDAAGQSQPMSVGTIVRLYDK